MVIKEYYKTRADGVRLYRHYSDNGKTLVQSQTEIEYSEAIDPENGTYTDTEGNDIEQVNGRAGYDRESKTHHNAPLQRSVLCREL